MISLEDQIMKSKSDTETLSHLPPELEQNRATLQPTISLTNVRFYSSRPVVYQTMLLTAILSALKQQHLSHMHRHWVATLTSSLPYLGRATSHMMVAVVNQLCRNIELLANQYELGIMYKG